MRKGIEGGSSRDEREAHTRKTMEREETGVKETREWEWKRKRKCKESLEIE